jgi:hypothetical protein
MGLHGMTCEVVVVLRYLLFRDIEKRSFFTKHNLVSRRGCSSEEATPFRRLPHLDNMFGRAEKRSVVQSCMTHFPLCKSHIPAPWARERYDDGRPSSNLKNGPGLSRTSDGP